jgi:hypothetical protein
MSLTQADFSQLIPLASILCSADQYGLVLDNTFTIAAKDAYEGPFEFGPEKVRAIRRPIRKTSTMKNNSQIRA